MKSQVQVEMFLFFPRMLPPLYDIALNKAFVLAASITSQNALITV